MQKLKQFNPQFITETFFPQYKNDPHKINWGQCFQWAYIAYMLFEGVELWDTHGHAFVRHQDKFYDSERLEGTTDWRELPAIASCRCRFCTTAYRKSWTAFKKAWKHSCKIYGTNWELIEKQIRENNHGTTVF